MIPAYLYYRHQQKKKGQQSASASRQMSISPGSSLIDRVTFTAPGVSAKLGDEIDEASYVSGVITLVEKPHGIFIEWAPVENPDDSTSEWVVTGSVDSNESAELASAKTGDGDRRTEELKKLRFSADIKDLRSFQCVEPRRGKSGSPWIRLISKDGTNYIPLYFRDGGLPEFTEHLQQYATLKRSAKENNLILFTDERAEALQQSVSALFSREVQSDFMSRLMANPYATAMTGLGKVANFVQDQVIPSLILDMDGLDPEEQAQALKELQQKDENDAGDLRLHDDAGFELVTKLDLPERPAFKREPPLVEQQWNAHKSSDGRFKDVRDLKLLIFRGGLTPGLRCDAWKFLLKYYDWNSTNEERVEVRKKRVDDYFRMKLQWKSISEDQEGRFGEFRDRKALVEKDVTRTDRTHRFFEGDNNANVSMLSDILMTYCMYNFDLGYVQGMSDCLSPILVVMENEVDAFWAFAGLMD
uniref:Rab-GAP TBC domain-containing protein n=1 Tax=Plectus sambesii TaxID=2011161 RepID=A0A914WEE1_9BILA